MYLSRVATSPSDSESPGLISENGRERNHQGIANALIDGVLATSAIGGIRRRPRLGGLLNYYERAA
jgi:hypothetical protein